MNDKSICFINRFSSHLFLSPLQLFQRCRPLACFSAEQLLCLLYGYQFNRVQSVFCCPLQLCRQQGWSEASVTDHPRMAAETVRPLDIFSAVVQRGEWLGASP